MSFFSLEVRSRPHWSRIRLLWAIYYIFFTILAKRGLYRDGTREQRSRLHFPWLGWEGPSPMILYQKSEDKRADCDVSHTGGFIVVLQNRRPLTRIEQSRSRTTWRRIRWSKKYLDKALRIRPAPRERGQGRAIEDHCHEPHRGRVTSNRRRHSALATTRFARGRGPRRP